MNYQLSIRKMNLSPHFTLKEMLRSEVAKKRKIENRINDEEVDNLVRLCTKVLEPLREHFGVPIKINSGFRCRDLNDAVKGADNSYHMKGRAVDIPMHPGWLAYIRDHLPHTELINEGTWIHVAL
jgi:uncharacterized protein YcbK (DUF882 family)